MTPYISKLTVHSLGGRRTGYGEFLRTIQAAGRRLPFVKCRDDFGPGYEAKQLWPDMPVVGAITNWDDERYDVKRLYNLILAKAAQNTHVTHWEVYNERKGEWQQQADTLLELMPMLERDGLHVCGFNCASGAFPYPSEDGGVAFEQIARFALRAKQGGHWLGLHGYGYDVADSLLRYRQLANFLFQRGALCDIALTEFGPDEGTFIGVEKYMAWAKAIDAELMKDRYVVGAALWTIGGAGWGDANCDAILHDFKDQPLVYLDEYISAVGEIKPPEPQGKLVKLTCAGQEPIIIDVPPGYAVEVEDIQ